MDLLKIGTTLLHKYRIERLRLQSRDVTLYEATDASRRHVCIKVFRRDPASHRMSADASARFEREVRGSNVIDVGVTGGMPFVVVLEWQQRKMPSQPPPLPARARKSSKPPPPLPVPIPIEVDEVAFEAPQMVFERPASARPPARRAWVWPAVALGLAAVMTGVGGWLVGHQISRPAPATIAPPLPPSDTEPDLASPPIEEKTSPSINVEPTPAQTDTTAPAAPPPPPPSASASTDPLTI